MARSDSTLPATTEAKKRIFKRLHDRGSATAGEMTEFAQSSHDAFSAWTSRIRDGVAAAAFDWRSLPVESALSNDFLASNFLYQPFDLGSHTQSLHVSQNESFEALRDAFAAIDDEMLRFGTRMEAIRGVLSQHMDAENGEFLSDLSRVLATETSEICDEKKAAAIRYLGIYDSGQRISSIVRILTDTLASNSVSKSMAAALSLRDLGDRGAVPAIVLAELKSGSEELRAELQRTIQSLVSTNEPD